MSIYFDFKTINELTGNNYYRKPKEFTLEDLSQYNGIDGNPAYVAIEGMVYDVSNTTTRGGSTHFELTAGKDLTSQFNSYHWIVDILANSPKVGVLIDDDYMIDMIDMNNMSNINNMNFRSIIPIDRQVKQDTSMFTPDDWIRYITPLVTYALRETTQGMNTQRAYEKFILLGVLVGLGKTPQEAINQVQEWQTTGASQLLKSDTSTGTSGGMGMEGSTVIGGGTMPNNKQAKQDTSKFTPDDWIRYITPLVTYALRETTQGMNTQRAYEKFILLGVLVGLGKTPQEAINQVQEWQTTGASQLLKSSTSSGGTNISGGIIGTGNAGTSGGMGIGGAGTSGGIGTGGSGTSGGMGIGGSTGTSDGPNISNRLYFD